MRTTPLLAAMLLTGCATAPDPAGPGALRGCWIERRGDQTITQRWFPKGDAWQGDELTYFPQGDPDPGRWRLEPAQAGAGWSMCMVELGKITGPPCWRAFFGPGQADGDDDRWVEVDVTAETLKLTWITAGERAVMYDARRDGCD